MFELNAALAVMLGYFLGSIPFGLILTRMAGFGDVRTMGSGNIGATNVLRNGNKRLAAATLLLDMGKGAAAVLIAGLIFPPAAVIAGGAAFLGHLYPVWLKFKGGKGVAIFLGILLALAWPVGLACSTTWFISALLFRYSSLAALIAAALAPLYAWFLAPPEVVMLSFALATIIYLKHVENIRRLAAGTEPKIDNTTSD